MLNRECGLGYNVAVNKRRFHPAKLAYQRGRRPADASANDASVCRLLPRSTTRALLGENYYPGGMTAYP